MYFEERERYAVIAAKDFIAANTEPHKDDKSAYQRIKGRVANASPEKKAKWDAEFDAAYQKSQPSLGLDDVVYKYTPIGDSKNGNVTDRMKAMKDDIQNLIDREVEREAVGFAEWAKRNDWSFLVEPEYWEKYVTVSQNIEGEWQHKTNSDLYTLYKSQNSKP